MKRILPWFALALVVTTATGCTEQALGPASGAPASPQGVAAVNTGSGWVLSWTPNLESDLAGYELYRSPAYTLSGDSYRLVHKAPTSVTSSPLVVEGGEWIYNVRARDLDGNLSAPSTGVLIEVSASAGGDSTIPDEGVVRATR
jgi:hypothetical protein